MNTHNIETVLRSFLTGDGFIAADDIPAICAIIEADRQQRGEAVAWRWSESNGERWFDWTTDWTHHDRAVEMGCLVEYAAPSAPQPAEPVKRKRRYAQGTALGEFGIIPMCDQVDDEPVKVASDLPVTEQEEEAWQQMEKQQ